MKSLSLLVLFAALAGDISNLFGADPTGASIAFSSQDAVVVKARTLVDAGKFKQAESLLAAKDAKAGAAALRARSEYADLIRRMRVEYSLDAAELLAKIQKSIPDATAKDVARWTQECRTRFRMIDGQKFFFRREPQNIFLFSKEAKHRLELAGNGKKAPDWQLTNHLAAIVAVAERTGAVEVVPIKHRVTHTLTIHPNNPAVKAGSVARVWLPYPQEYRQQSDVKLISASPEPKLIAPSGVDGNPVSGGAQRTIYFEQKVSDPAQPLVFREIFEFTSFAYYPKLDEAQVKALPADWNGAYLGERLPHIAFTPAIREQVTQIIGTETNALAKARKIFRWVSANIPWNAEDEYCIIPSFAIKGFTARCGDCGVQNTLFVTMCRIAGVPARWQALPLAVL